MGKHYRHVTLHDRLKIEALYNAKHSIQEIATQLGFSYPTIWREIKKRGTYVHRNFDWTEENRYSSVISQKRCDELKKTHGKELKIGNDYEFVRFVEEKVLKDKYSPQAILYEIKRKQLSFQTNICVSTLYNYIRNDVFLNVSSKDLPLPRSKQRKRRKRYQRRASFGTSIEKRSEEINQAKDIGHWEMDSVVGPLGNSKKAFLVLTERKSLLEIIEPLRNHSSREVVKALNRIERRMGEKEFRKVFKSITVDNGLEFADWKGLEKSRRSKKKRTKIYFCHAFCSFERGKNENQNKFIRRFYPKGKNFDYITMGNVKKLERWINDYPRPTFQGKSSKEVYAAFRKLSPEEKAS